MQEGDVADRRRAAQQAEAEEVVLDTPGIAEGGEGSTGGQRGVGARIGRD